MFNIISIASILLTVLLGAMSPGASFLTVARISMAQSRKNGLLAAVGMGSGSVLLCLFALLGLKMVFASYPILYIGLQGIGACYLVYIGITIWRQAKEPIRIDGEEDALSKDHQAFPRAFLIQISNPKTILFYAGVIASLLPDYISLWTSVLLLILIFIVESGWYCLVALLLSSQGPRSVYLSLKTWIDRVAGGLMLFLGIRLLWNALREVIG